MAERRMLAKNIISSARFIKMPQSSQNLYFHLSLYADDDGVVEAFPVMRITGCTEDDLKILAAKEFIKILNQDYVTYIMDWREHNQIRADRKVDSRYKDLLLEILPDTKLLESKSRSDLKKEKENSMDVQRTSMCSPDGRPCADQSKGDGRKSIGKVSIGKYNKRKSKKEKISFSTHNFKNFTFEDFESDVGSFPELSEFWEEFIDYWTEPDAKGKMKFQLQKTWDTKRRLGTWKRRNFQNSSNSSVSKTGFKHKNEVDDYAMPTDDEEI